MCLAAYAALSMVLAFMSVNHLPNVIDVHWPPLIRKVAACSTDPRRIYAYWQWMLIAYPLVLTAFTLVTPVKIKDPPMERFRAAAGCAAVFIIFGLVLIPLLIWGIFWDDSGWSAASLDRVFRSSCHSWVSLGLSGIITMIPLCCLMWITYVATPMAAVKSLK